MSLIPFVSRYSPLSIYRDPFFQTTTLLENDFDSLFDTSMSKFMNDSHKVARTSVDVRETSNSFHLTADLPGLKREEIKVQIENGNVLSIGGEQRREAKEESEKYYCVERSNGKFLRKFRLPPNVDVSKISAKCENGILDVIVPKVAPQPEKPKAIDVQIQ